MDSFTVLDTPVDRLQTLLKPPLPWSFVAGQLVALLKRYSNGLSFEIAAEEISSAWQAHENQTIHEDPSLFMSGKILAIAPGPPELWLARLSDSSIVAWFAHSSLERRFKIGTEFSFATSEAMEVANNSPDSEFLRLAREAFEGISSGVYTSPECVDSSTKTDPHSTPAKRVPRHMPGEGSSQSPADITKFPSLGEKKAITPSQVPESNLTSGLKKVLLPTARIYADLDTIDHAVIGLLEPPESFSLQRVWNERSLTPSWIFASVVEVNELHLSIRLQNPSLNQVSDQPSVLWRLAPEFNGLANILKSGFEVLLQNPSVEPTGSSFELLCLPHTSCYYRRKQCPGVLEKESGPDSVQATRPTKRRRVEPDLAELITTVTTKELSQLICPESQSVLTVHSRVIAPPEAQGSIVSILSCEHDVRIRVTGLRMVEKSTSIQPGDEILFRDVVWVPPVISFGSQTLAGWFAQSFENLSVMNGFLLSSFTRIVHRMNSISDLSSHIGKGRSSCSSRTLHVRVHIHDISVSLGDKKLLVSVRDVSPSRVHLSRENAGYDIEEAENMKNRDAQDLHQVAIHERGFEELFRTPNAQLFWSNDPERKVAHSLPRLRSGSWIMTVSCNSASSGSTPVLCACMHGLVK